MELHSLKLIDSSYPAGKACSVLMSLIDDKIKFINAQIFSMTERFGSDTEHLERRIEELKADREELRKVLHACDQDNDLIEIDCKVNITIHSMETI